MLYPKAAFDYFMEPKRRVCIGPTVPLRRLPTYSGTCPHCIVGPPNHMAQFPNSGLQGANSPTTWRRRVEKSCLLAIISHNSACSAGHHRPAGKQARPPAGKEEGREGSPPPLTSTKTDKSRFTCRKFAAAASVGASRLFSPSRTAVVTNRNKNLQCSSLGPRTHDVRHFSTPFLYKANKIFLLLS